MRETLIIAASVIVAIIIIVVAAIFLRVWRIPFSQVEVFGISHSTVHWIGWIGTLYIAFATPLYPIVKRKYSLHLKNILNVHVTGNLLGVLLVSIHFAHQVTRSATNYPDLGTGIVLYTSMILLVVSGLVLVSGIGQRFFKKMHFLHPAYATTFYTVIVIHILQDVLFPGLFT